MTIKKTVFLILIMMGIASAGCSKHGADIYSDTLNELR